MILYFYYNLFVSNKNSVIFVLSIKAQLKNVIMKTTYKHQLKALAFERVMQHMVDLKETDHTKTKRYCKSFIKQELFFIKQLR